MKRPLMFCYGTFVMLYLIFNSTMTAAPPKEIPSNYLIQFTLDGQIPVSKWYLNDSYPGRCPIFWSKKKINRLIYLAKLHTTLYYGETDNYLYRVLEKYNFAIRNKRVAIIGSVTPWYESIVLAYGGHPITIEYNKPRTDDSRLEVMSVEEYENNPQEFDTVISISSIEHSGLGRYGDPINPYGDFESMNKIKSMLKKGGLLILAVPVGQDLLVWNAHRIYGPIRLPLLFDGWELVDSQGFSEDDFLISFENFYSKSHHQPVFVLCPLEGETK